MRLVSVKMIIPISHRDDIALHQFLSIFYIQHQKQCSSSSGISKVEFVQSVWKRMSPS